MKYFFKSGFTAIALMFVFSTFAATETHAQITNEILKRMDEHYKAMKSLQANVTRETFNSQLGETDKRDAAMVFPLD